MFYTKRHYTMVVFEDNHPISFSQVLDGSDEEMARTLVRASSGRIPKQSVRIFLLREHETMPVNVMREPYMTLTTAQKKIP